jgi:hypothetical protein
LGDSQFDAGPKSLFSAFNLFFGTAEKVLMERGIYSALYAQHEHDFFVRWRRPNKTAPARVHRGRFEED